MKVIYLSPLFFALRGCHMAARMESWRELARSELRRAREIRDAELRGYVRELHHQANLFARAFIRDLRAVRKLYAQSLNNPFNH